MTANIRTALEAHAEACRVATRELRPRPDLPQDLRAYLADANLADANLADANLARANLARANLAGAYLADANLAGANLAGAKGLDPFVQIGPIGSRLAMLTVRRTKDGILAQTGCFSGTLEQFAEAVQAKYGDSKHGRDYLAAIEMARVVLAEEPSA